MKGKLLTFTCWVIFATILSIIEFGIYYLTLGPVPSINEIDTRKTAEAKCKLNVDIVDYQNNYWVDSYSYSVLDKIDLKDTHPIINDLYVIERSKTFCEDSFIICMESINNYQQCKNAKNTAKSFLDWRAIKLQQEYMHLIKE